MTDITVSRELLRQALETLTCTGEDDDPGHRCGYCDDYVDRNGPVRKALRAAIEQAPVQEPDTSCKFPMCQTEQYQQMLEAQVARDLFGIEQPSKAVKLSDGEVASIVKEAAKNGAMRRDGSTSQRVARAIEQAVLKANGVEP